ANFSIKKKRNDEQQNLLRYIPSGTARGMGIFFAKNAVFFCPVSTRQFLYVCYGGGYTNSQLSY
ncbi:hypothetical protein, partial [uncultured Dubosiella sp.]|uniref:hypothetical protein n=1 Tax=uncultured Dubosiella sp. TaxID=1937011 RepID=UPI002625BE0A